MNRAYSLPEGWYPRNPVEVIRFLSGFAPGKALAAIAPHAGWFYSGRIAAKAVAVLDRQAETIVILGGHLPAGSPPLFALEDGVQTPLGTMPIDAELRESLLGELNGKEDCYRDNTVEVLLPMARYFFPGASLVWIRLPADNSSSGAGLALARAADHLKRKIVVLASTDLTHYGTNYGFVPKGSGPEALQWVKKVNDHNFIHAVEAGNPAAVLERATQDFSSCSAGAVLGAMAFAQALDAGPARLLEYATSADVLSGEDLPGSFVGYAAFAFDK